MNHNHTPGPWRVFICDDGGKWNGWPLSIYTDDPKRTVCRPGGIYPHDWKHSISQREAVANARLIAAAPTMLAALQAIARAWDHPGWTEQIALTIKQVRAAIADAEGQS